MDPIRTFVKYSLIPLRTVVQIGELFVAAGESQREQPAPAPAPQAAQPQPQRRTPQRRPSAQKASPPRRAGASRQASQTPKDLDDVGLARKVETVIFRDNSVPKGKIDVNAADGVVWLRGEAKTPDMIKALERQANEIPEVKRVENLLHLPKTPAPTRTDTPPSQRKTRSTTRRPTARKVETGITNERRTTHGEPLPEEVARDGEGRRPAPLGSKGSGS
jgi:hypothetical protein